VGSILSQKRRTAAESGSSHITARKLGALFEHLLPNTPRLFECYGLRASEIAQSSELRDTPAQSNGIFAEQAGVDATSIWAAATSGKGAVAVHLLACMLSPMWSGSQATSIWAETIAERKKELSENASADSFHFSTPLAAQVTLSRDQLAEWDNSARAWLRVADEVKSFQQTQLMLVIKNINVLVNPHKGNLYGSVIAAWTKALELMECLLSGTA
jgi:hypothetical protein